MVAPDERAAAGRAAVGDIHGQVLSADGEVVASRPRCPSGWSTPRVGDGYADARIQVYDDFDEEENNKGEPDVGETRKSTTRPVVVFMKRDDDQIVVVARTGGHRRRRRGGANSS